MNTEAVKEILEWKVIDISKKRFRAYSTVKGNVQGVGYRALVKQLARGHGMKGAVRNREEGIVEIWCEADTEEEISEFLTNIDVKSDDPSNPFALNVEGIETLWEGEEGFETEYGYVHPDRELGHFEADYGEEAKTPVEKANLERLEIDTLMMLNLGQNVGKVGKEVKEGFSTTHTDFKELDGKYDVVSTELKSINKNISNLDHNISKRVDHLGTILDTVVKNKK